MIIISSLSLESFLSCYFKRRRAHKDYALIEWASDESLQLQRLAQEGIGWGTWSNCTEIIPTTAGTGETLGSVDISDLDHPKLYRPGHYDLTEKLTSNSTTELANARALMCVQAGGSPITAAES
jgi:hypothetical protein